MKRFLIGQLACFGDCLYATTVAKQIKHDYPGSHITWAVASRYKSVLELNPHIDEIWEIPLVNNDYYDEGWSRFQTEAQRRLKANVYDEVVYTQLARKNWKNFDGTIRSSTLRGYKKPITVTVDPVIRLTLEEINKVQHFTEKHKLEAFKEVILFEYSPGSGQSFITLDIALQIAEAIIASYNDVCFIFTGPKKIKQTNHQIIDASELSFRENAELTKYCTMLLGCSSGITWLSTSDWSKKLKMVQLLDKHYAIFAGVQYDFEHWNIPTNTVIEITLNNSGHVINCLKMILDKGFEAAKSTFDEVYKPSYFNFQIIIDELFRKYRNLSQVASVTFLYSKRNKHLSYSRLLYYSLRQIYKTSKPGNYIFMRNVIRKFIKFSS